MTGKRVIVNKPGQSPTYHQNRIPRLLRQAVQEKQISPAWQIPMLMRHCDAAQVNRPKSLYADMTYPYVIAALSTLPGNTIVDPKGYATALLHEMVPEIPINFNPIVRDMADANLVTKTLGAGGRRTTSITATPDGLALLDGWLPHQPAPDDLWLGDYGPVHPPLASVVPISAPVETASAIDDIDVTSLSRLCLRLGIERDEWASKFFQAEGNIDKLVQRMADQETELQELRRRLDGTTTVYSSESTKNSLRARLSDDERASLDRLMREVPTG